MGTRVVIVQHAQKEQGSGDPGLTPEGRHQAAATSEYLRSLGLRVRGVYASPMRRAQQTAQPIATALALPVTTDDRLRERGNWDGPEIQSLEEFLDEWNRCSGDRNFVPRVGDSSHQAGARFRAFLGDLGDDGTHIVVAHGGVTTDLLRDLLGDSELLARQPDIIGTGVRPCGVTELERDGEAWVALRIGDGSHLGL